MVLPPGHCGDFPRVSPSQKSKVTRYSIEGLNSFATILYFNYLYFLMRAKFGFSDCQNLEFAALLGLVYALAAGRILTLPPRIWFRKGCERFLIRPERKNQPKETDEH